MARVGMAKCEMAKCEKARCVKFLFHLISATRNEMAEAAVAPTEEI
jgi:hypothetical protein